MFLWTVVTSRCSGIGSLSMRTLGPIKRPHELPKGRNAPRAWKWQVTGSRSREPPHLLMGYFIPKPHLFTPVVVPMLPTHPTLLSQSAHYGHDMHLSLHGPVSQLLVNRRPNCKYAVSCRQEPKWRCYRSTKTAHSRKC